MRAQDNRKEETTLPEIRTHRIRATPQTETRRRVDKTTEQENPEIIPTPKTPTKNQENQENQEKASKTKPPNLAQNLRPQTLIRTRTPQIREPLPKRLKTAAVKAISKAELVETRKAAQEMVKTSQTLLRIILREPQTGQIPKTNPVPNQAPPPLPLIQRLTIHQVPLSKRRQVRRSLKTHFRKS